MIRITITPGTTHLSNLREKTIKSKAIVLTLKLHATSIFLNNVFPFFNSKQPMSRLSVSCERLSSDHPSLKRTHDESDRNEGAQIDVGSLLVEVDVPPPKKKKLAPRKQPKRNVTTRKALKSQSQQNETQNNSEPLFMTIKCEADQDFPINVGERFSRIKPGGYGLVFVVMKVRGSRAMESCSM